MLKKATALADAGRTAEAEALFAKLLGIRPNSPDAMRAVINFHNRYSRKFRQALPVALNLVKSRPKSAEAHRLAAETFFNCTRHFAALHHADIALSLAPDDPDVLFIAAVVYMHLDRNDAALAFLDHALALHPDHRPSHLQRGRAFLNMGQTDAAGDVARRLLADRPDNLDALSLYVNATRMARGDPVLAEMEKHLSVFEKRGGEPLATFLKLLGKAYNDLADYDQAFTSFARAKTIAPLPYDPNKYTQFVSTLCTNISRADYLGRGGSKSDRPVLIVGMPRSGSSLLEQILASHPQVTGVGESTSLYGIAQDTRIRPHDGPHMAAAIKQIPPDATKRLAARYLAETKGADENALRVVDKALHNYELLGFFATLLPNARIIHMMRDPMDTCVSCYMQPLSAWHRYTQNLTALGQTYVQYRRLMAHWKTALPNPMLDVAYEDIVADTQTQARRVVDFLGLPWDDACLDFQASENQSRTLSSWQVRQPIYTASVRRWVRYDAHLGPLKAALAPLYPVGLRPDEAP